MDRFNSREDIEIDVAHPAFIAGSEAWSKGAPLSENPYKTNQRHLHQLWIYGWTDSDQGYGSQIETPSKG